MINEFQFTYHNEFLWIRTGDVLIACIIINMIVFLFAFCFSIGAANEAYTNEHNDKYTYVYPFSIIIFFVCLFWIQIGLIKSILSTLDYLEGYYILMAFVSIVGGYLLCLFASMMCVGFISICFEIIKTNCCCKFKSKTRSSSIYYHYDNQQELDMRSSFV